MVILNIRYGHSENRHLEYRNRRKQDNLRKYKIKHIPKIGILYILNIGNGHLEYHEKKIKHVHFRNLFYFQTLSLLEIFNIIQYANCTAYDITVQNNFSKININSQYDQLTYSAQKCRDQAIKFTHEKCSFSWVFCSSGASAISEGDIFIYSCSAQLISFEVDSISKEINCAEHEYMNMSPSLIALAPLLVFLPFATKLAISKILSMHSDVISCVICILNKVEYLEKEKSCIERLFLESNFAM